MPNTERDLNKIINEVADSAEREALVNLRIRFIRSRMERRKQHPDLNINAIEASFGMPPLADYLNKRDVAQVLEAGSDGTEITQPEHSPEGEEQKNIPVEQVSAEVLQNEVQQQQVETTPTQVEGQGTASKDSQQPQPEVAIDPARNVEVEQTEEKRRLFEKARAGYVSELVLFKKDTTGWRRIKRGNKEWYQQYIDDLAGAKTDYYQALNDYVKILHKNASSDPEFNEALWKSSIFNNFVLGEAGLVDFSVEQELHDQKGKVKRAIENFSKNWSKLSLGKKVLISGTLAGTAAFAGAASLPIVAGVAMRRAVGTVVGAGTGMTVGEGLGRIRDKFLSRRKEKYDKVAMEGALKKNAEELLQNLTSELDKAFVQNKKQKRWEKGTRAVQVAALVGTSFAVGKGVADTYHDLFSTNPQIDTLSTIEKPKIGSVLDSRTGGYAKNSVDLAQQSRPTADVEANKIISPVKNSALEGLDEKVNNANHHLVADLDAKVETGQVKINPDAVVGAKQGAWHPVYKQFEAKLHADPVKYGFSQEQLSDPDAVKARLNELTTTELRRAGFIGEGSELRFTKPGAVLELDANDHIKTDVSELRTSGVVNDFRTSEVSGEVGVGPGVSADLETPHPQAGLDPVQKFDLEQNLDPYNVFTDQSGGEGMPIGGEELVDSGAGKPGFDFKTTNPDFHEQTLVEEGSLPKLGTNVEQFSQIPLNKNEFFTTNLLGVDVEQYKLLRSLTLPELQRIAQLDLENELTDGWYGHKVTLHFLDGTNMVVDRAELGSLPEVADYMLQNPEKFSGATQEFLGEQSLYGLIRDKQSWINYAYSSINKNN